MPDHRHFILHKPYGYLSQFINNQNKRRNKKLLGTLHNFPKGAMSIGRLDENSEGLLLLTTNGVISARVNGRKVEKEYYVQLDGEITPSALDEMSKGVTIGIRGKPYQTLPCQAVLLAAPPRAAASGGRNKAKLHRPTSWASITITEGKFRQVRKMTAAVGFPTLRLIRMRVGHIELGTLAAGEVMEVEGFGFEGFE